MPRSPLAVGIITDGETQPHQSMVGQPDASVTPPEVEQHQVHEVFEEEALPIKLTQNVRQLLDIASSFQGPD